MTCRTCVDIRTASQWSRWVSRGDGEGMASQGDGESRGWWVEGMVSRGDGESRGWWVEGMVNRGDGESRGWWVEGMVSRGDGESRGWWVEGMVSQGDEGSRGWWVESVRTDIAGFYHLSSHKKNAASPPITPYSQQVIQKVTGGSAAKTCDIVDCRIN